MSVSMKLAKALLNVASRDSRKSMESAELLRESLKTPKAPAEPPHSLLKHGTLEEGTIEGSTVWRFTPRNARVGVEGLYLPGGGYINPIQGAHWWIIREIALRTGAAITVALYPIAPAQHADDSEAMIDAAWNEIAKRPATKAMFAIGDSAGGHAALSLARRMLDNKGRVPDGLALLAPWLDLALKNPAARKREPLDVGLRVEGLREAGRLWAVPYDLEDPRYDLTQIEIDDLPPMVIAQGLCDIFYDDTRAFVSELEHAGKEVRSFFEPDGFHVYPGAFWTPEAKRAFQGIASQMGSVVTRIEASHK